MAWIPYVADEAAEGLLAEHYRRFREPWGGVDHILRIHSLDPPSLGHHATLYGHLMRGRSPLTRVQRETIALAVSSANDCFY
jgi:alkylhydroperoxidase family enzyme